MISCMKKGKLFAWLLTICLVMSMGMPIESSAAPKVKLSKTSLTLTVGQSKTLKVKNTKSKVKWSSSNKKVASVSQKGLVKAKKTGNAKIYAKVGSKKFTCKVKVKATPSLNKTKVTLKQGDSVTLKVKNASGKIKWKTSNKSVATVTQKGVVKSKMLEVQLFQQWFQIKL